MDDALRLMPATLASEVRAAVTASSSFSLATNELHDLTPDLCANPLETGDLEMFLDTEYIQLLERSSPPHHDVNDEHAISAILNDPFKIESALQGSPTSPPAPTVVPTMSVQQDLKAAGDIRSANELMST